MSNARNIGDSAPVINFLDGVTSDIQTQLNTLDTAIGNVSVTSGSLTKTFAADETATVTLSGNVLAPVVTATKEVAQTGVTNNDWDAAAASYTLENSAPSTTLNFVGYDLSNTSYVDSFSVASQDTDPTGLAFNSDGSKMYVVGNSANAIHEYALSTAFDVSTASFSHSFSTTAHTTSPSGITFKPDGTIMYVSEAYNSAILQYALSTAFNVSTATYTQTYNVSTQEADVRGVAFNSDGSKMFITGIGGDDVNEYALSTGYDISTATYTQNFSVSSQDANPQDLFFNSDGTTMWIVGDDNDSIFEYTLTTGFDVSTASYASVSFSVTSQDTSPMGAAFNSDGTKLFVVGLQNDSVYEYTVPQTAALGTGSFASSDVGKTIEANSGKFVLTSTAGVLNVLTTPSSYNQVASGSWQMYALVYDSTADVLKPSGVAGAGFDLSVAAYTGDTLSANILHGMCFGNNGTKMYTLQSNSSIGNINEYTLSTAYLPSSATYVAGYSVRAEDTQSRGIAISADGTKLFMVGTANDKIYLYNLSTAFSVNSATYSSTSYDLSSATGIPTGITWNADGTKLYMCEQNYNYVYQYNASTAYDITTLSSSSSFGPTNSYETQLEGVAISADGKKIFVTGGGSDKVHEYSLPTAFSLTGATYVQAFDVSGQTTVPSDVQFTPDGAYMYVTSSVQGIWQYSTQSVTTATGYQPAIGSTIDSTYWTDLNSMTATNAVGDGNVFYALSADGKTSWNILSNGTGATFVVTVAGGKFVIDGVSQDSLTLQEGQTYIFDQADATNATHPLRLSTTSDGTHGGGTEYTTGVTTSGTAGSSGAYTQIVVAAGAPTLYYYCSAHSGMGGTITIGVTGVRKIVKNNGGTYQVNTNSTYGSETWANAATNTEVAALRESMTSATALNGYQLSAAAYDSKSFNFASQDNQCRGVRFNLDGTKMYMNGVTSDGFFQYSLSTAYDISTASYDSVSFTGSEDGNMEGFCFNNDGTKIFGIGLNNFRVYQYTLSTAFDLSTMSYSSVSLLISGQDNSPRDIGFNNDGTKMYMIGRQQSAIFEYTLTTAYDLSTASYASKNYGVVAQEANPSGFIFSADGTRMFVTGLDGDDINAYNLSTAFDITTATYDTNFSVSGQVSNPQGIATNGDGTKMYIIDNPYPTAMVYQYSTTTTSYPNQMTSTELNAINDASQITLGTALDLATIIYYASGSSTPTYSGTAINYDANVINQGAILGTDYTYDAPAQNKVRVTSVNAANLKIRVV